jgi:hypothetical protein
VVIQFNLPPAKITSPPYRLEADVGAELREIHSTSMTQFSTKAIEKDEKTLAFGIPADIGIVLRDGTQSAIPAWWHRP